MTAHHYRWKDLETDAPMELLTRRRILGEKAMLSEVFLEKGCFVPTHAHENEQFAVILSGALRFDLGDEDHPDELVVRAGEVLHLPSMQPHSAYALEDTRVLDVFSPPSEATGIDQD